MIPERSSAHWSTLTTDPTSKIARDHVRACLQRAYAGRTFDSLRLILDGVAGKSVLHIGAVEHDESFMSRPGWKHAHLTSAASECFAIDISPDGVAALRRRGYDAAVCDATSKDFLGRKFEVVFAGDVIEHVRDASALISFCGRHIDSPGRVILTSPNPYWFRDIISVATHQYIPNVDHVSWITPPNVLELAHRSGMRLKRYWQVQPHGGRSFSWVFHRVRDIALKNSELFAWAFVYELTHDVSEE